jgi:hypothetical protein
MFTGVTRCNCERHSHRLQYGGILSHGPVETAHRHRLAFYVSPSQGIFYGSSLLGRLHCDAQPSIKDKENVKASSKRTRHFRRPTSLSAFCDRALFNLESKINNYSGLASGWRHV